MTEFWKESPALEARLERVAAAIDATVDGSGFPLREAVAVAAEAKGKLLRPALLIIGSSFGRAADPNRIERLAAAVELLHVATLVHDDIIDEAPIRRGRPSLYASVGVKEAVLSGDWLFSRCFLLSSESAEPENAKGLARLIAAVCSAEITQDLSKYRYSSSARSYFRTIAGKTAALFSLALHAGATEAKAGARAAQTLRRAGYDMGMAFQVIDDILDFESAQDVLRKPVGKDIAEGLCTLPLIYAIQADGPSMRAILSRVPRPGDQAAQGSTAAAEAAARAIELGGPERARADARRFTARALAEIAKLPPSPARDELGRLAERLLHREY
jgi:heptaprenyl diphosphate synthase